MTPAGFEPTISTGEQPQTYALDRAATGTGYTGLYSVQFGDEVKFFGRTCCLHFDYVFKVILSEGRDSRLFEKRCYCLSECVMSLFGRR
jgi:hypothetical protein